MIPEVSVFKSIQPGVLRSSASGLVEAINFKTLDILYNGEALPLAALPLRIISLLPTIREKVPEAI